jgi:hypothetical protein
MVRPAGMEDLGESLKSNKKGKKNDQVLKCMKKVHSTST